MMTHLDEHASHVLDFQRDQYKQLKALIPEMRAGLAKVAELQGLLLITRFLHRNDDEAYEACSQHGTYIWELGRKMYHKCDNYSQLRDCLHDPDYHDEHDRNEIIKQLDKLEQRVV